MVNVVLSAPPCARRNTDAALATNMANELLRRGIYVIGFSYPVVPKGKARIRTQMSAAHSRTDLEAAAAAFEAVRAAGPDGPG